MNRSKLEHDEIWAIGVRVWGAGEEGSQTQKRHGMGEILVVAATRVFLVLMGKHPDMWVELEPSPSPSSPTFEFNKLLKSSVTYCTTNELAVVCYDVAQRCSTVRLAASQPHKYDHLQLTQIQLDRRWCNIDHCRQSGLSLLPRRACGKNEVNNGATENLVVLGEPNLPLQR